ncbi:sugar transporter family protein [Heterostelium album PN500]|uniref:Sugar transporter family protein n=1 Tax=Heterostelium pallidum (strain ATCC 26659 / Pp 5 / PN500) TaxID=670386 RepID=D3BQB2_HETP5|nr:sugar transporter family protein [Heterostelium album PN500]EFA76332.1 sugar transporter family protein [Heterostelium album PN500]|eukprot:XP_020428464.1 sugar transporter family protein [Heterostelium album PN500]
MTLDHDTEKIDSYNQLQSSGYSERITKESHLRYIFRLYFNVFVAVLSTFYYGFATGVLAPTFIKIYEDYHYSKQIQSLFVSVLLIGGMVGSFSSSFFMDKLGRRNTLIYNNILIFIGVLLSSFSYNLPFFYFSRFISGFSAGVGSAVVPVYIAEIAPPEKRGSLGVVRQISVTSGVISSSLAAFGLNRIHNGWRYTFGISAATGVIQLILCFWFFESPRWLLSKNKTKEAILVISKLNAEKSSEEIQSLIQKIQNDLSTQKENESWQQLFKLKYWRVFLIGFSLCSFQQFVGINSLVYYSADILMKSGFDHSMAVLLSALIGIPQIIMLLISLWAIDRFGRKPLLYIGLSGMIVGAVVLGYTFWNDGSDKSRTLSIVAVVSMILFKISFSLCLGSIPFIIASEIYPNKIRGKAMSIATLGTWLANILANVLYLPLVEALGHSGLYWFYSGSCLLCLLFVAIFVPETKGIPIEELYKMLIKENESPTKIITSSPQKNNDKV